MYICKKCGNSAKFIGFVQEQGKAFIYQKDCSTAPDRIGDAENKSKKDEIYTELISENISWAYFLSDKAWNCSFELKKCYYCNSSDISWH